MRDQFPGRRLIEYRYRPLLYQALEQFPSVGIVVSRVVMDFMDAVRAWEVREFDAAADADVPAGRRRGSPASRCCGTSPRPRPSRSAPVRCTARIAPAAGSDRLRGGCINGEPHLRRAALDPQRKLSREAATLRSVRGAAAA